MRPVLSALALALAFLTTPLPLRAADPPATDTGPVAATASAVPWGDTASGLACRILVPETLVPGEPLFLAIELKNTTDHPLVLLDKFAFIYKQYASLTLKDAAGNKYQPGASASFSGLSPNLFATLAPGEIKRLMFADIQGEFYMPKSRHVPVLASPGKYELVYTFTSPKPARGVVGAKMVDGKQVDTYVDPTPEQLANAWTDKVTSNTATITIKDLTEKNLTVHEWGVFSTFNDEKLANVEMKEEWAGMPGFFYTQFPQQKLKSIPTRVRKPILYFYTDRPGLSVNAKVTFAEGAPVIWWPCTSSPVQSDGRPVPLFRSLEWSAFLGESAPPYNDIYGLTKIQAPPPLKEKPLPEKSWLTKTRIKGPTLLSVEGPSFARFRAPMVEAESTREAEHFLYYDGLVPALDYLRLSPDAATLQSTAKFPLTHIILIDRRAAEKDGPVRWCVVAKLGAEAKANLTWKETIPAGFPHNHIANDPLAGELPAMLAADLKSAGLFDNEIKSILGIWDTGLWERHGITAIYLAPQSEYDRILPLEITPQPPKVVRVGIIVHTNLETDPTLAARVAALVAKLGDAEFATRERAAKDLLDLTPRILPLLRKAAAEATDEETRARLTAILTQVDGAKYLDPAPRPKP